ncbi:hypothetical protein SynPROSU1_01759 [Synechococcus sp. PROS-U-1]|nr:hypothetical protein SynPROSU1_01759 [Synechococcus sp. PROS-U-1]
MFSPTPPSALCGIETLTAIKHRCDLDHKKQKEANRPSIS